MNVHKIYALSTTRENIQLALAVRFQRITASYILIFADEQPEIGYEISGDDTRELSLADVEWIKSCIRILAAEYAIEHESEIAEETIKFLSEFEAELQIEREKLAQEENVG